MSRHAPRHSAAALPVDSAADSDQAAAAIRDQLTREWLAVAALARQSDRAECDVYFDVLDFDPHWWDGQAYDPCLVISADGSRLRVVESAGVAVVLPFRRRAAGRLLGAARRPRPQQLTVPKPRSADAAVVHIEASEDVIRCDTEGCGVLRDITATDPCPRCGTRR